MFNRILVSFFLVLSFSYIHGVVFEVNDLSVFEKEVVSLNRNSLVLFDVDYTLLTPKDAALKPCGKGLRRKYLYPLSPQRREWLQSIIALDAEEELMDYKFPALIEMMQKAHVPVIGFTALETGNYGKVENLEDWRLNQLKKFGIDFSPTFQNHEILFSEMITHNGHDPVFKSGVLFTNRLSKGDVLLSFFKIIDWQPSKIVFMDDSLDQLKAVESIANSLNIDFVGFHYTAAITSCGAFDERVGEFQFKNLVENECWLSDSFVREFLEKQNPK